MGNIRATQMTFTETERVTMGQRAPEAIRDQAEKMDARRVFILAPRSSASWATAMPPPSAALPRTRPARTCSAPPMPPVRRGPI